MEVKEVETEEVEIIDPWQFDATEPEGRKEERQEKEETPAFDYPDRRFYMYPI